MYICKYICKSLSLGVPVMPANAPCCNCPGRMRECVLPLEGPANGCYKNANGRYQDFASFRDLYEQYCLAKKTVDPANWSYGSCPDNVPKVTPEECECHVFRHVCWVHVC